MNLHHFNKCLAREWGRGKNLWERRDGMKSCEVRTDGEISGRMVERENVRTWVFDGDLKVVRRKGWRT